MDPYRRRPSGELIASEPLSSRTRLRAAVSFSPQSGDALPYTRVRHVLLRYLSEILVDSVLDRAMHARQATPASLTSSQLGEVTGDIMTGLRLFVREEELPQLMLELAEILESEE